MFTNSKTIATYVYAAGQTSISFLVGTLVKVTREILHRNRMVYQGKSGGYRILLTNILLAPEHPGEAEDDFDWPIQDGFGYYNRKTSRIDKEFIKECCDNMDSLLVFVSIRSPSSSLA